MKRILIIFMLIFCYISLTATKACQDDYVVFKAVVTPTETPESEEETPTPTPTKSVTATPTSEGEWTPISQTPTPTPTVDYDDEDDDDEDDELTAGVSTNKGLYAELEELSQEDDITDEEKLINDVAENEETIFLDTDKDGYSDDLEIEYSTDPSSNTSYPNIIKNKLNDRIDMQVLNTLIEKDSIDTDGDGLSDVVENFIGSDINNIDTDNDGISDYRECLNNSDPVLSEF